MKLQRFEVRVPKFAQALTVGFAFLFNRPKYGASYIKQRAIEAVGAFEQPVLEGVLGNDSLCFGDVTPCWQDLLGLRRPCDSSPQLLLFGLLFLHNHRIEQAGEHAITSLAAVLHAEQKILGPPGVFLVFRTVDRQRHLQVVQPL